MSRKCKVAIVGAGSLASGLAPALNRAGYKISQVIHRNSRRSMTAARRLAEKVRARAVAVGSVALDADLLWFCVPDGEIRGAAADFARRGGSKIRYAFHSSGALGSGELDRLREKGIAVASVHPLMTFVPGSQPDLSGVPFAVEGDPAATHLAQRIVRDLGGEGFLLPVARKAAYHTWATMTSPMLVAFLVTLEEAARAAGLKAPEARRKSLPIIRQTLSNYARMGAARSFSGPIIRGDAATVRKHLAVLRSIASVRDVYVALAGAALRDLPARNLQELRRLIKSR